MILLGLSTPSAWAADRTYTLSDTAWKVVIPDTYKPRASAVADVLVHFHGDTTTYVGQVKSAKLNTIVLTCNYGAASSAYQTPLTTNPSVYANMLTEALAKVQQQADFADNLQWDKLTVSSFSAGYGAVREILKNPTQFNDIDCLVSTDTIYASYTSNLDHTPLDSQMVNFRSFAQQAKIGAKTMFLTHSQVPTPGYCSTIDTADDILSFIGVAPTATSEIGAGGVQYYRKAAAGNFKMYGATGSDGTSHLLHLQQSSQWLTQLPISHVPEPSMILVLPTVVCAMARRRR
jgi:hypothetical protein